MDLRELLTRSLVLDVKAQLESRSDVAKFEMDVQANKALSTVFLDPDWRVYSFTLNKTQCMNLLNLSDSNAATLIFVITNSIASKIKILNSNVVNGVINDQTPFFKLKNHPWHKCSAAQNSQLIKTLKWSAPNIGLNNLSIYSCSLPFYDNTRLIAFTIAVSKCERVCLYSLETTHSDDKLSYFELTGTPNPIFEVNKVSTIKICRKNALDYLYFFNFFVSGEHGIFYLLRDLFDTALPKLVWQEISMDKARFLSLESVYKQPKIILENQNRWVCQAFMYYGQRVYEVDIQINSDGTVNMLKERVISDPLPYRLQIQLNQQQDE